MLKEGTIINKSRKWNNEMKCRRENGVSTSGTQWNNNLWKPLGLSRSMKEATREMKKQENKPWYFINNRLYRLMAMLRRHNQSNQKKEGKSRRSREIRRKERNRKKMKCLRRSPVKWHRRIWNIWKSINIPHIFKLYLNQKINRRNQHRPHRKQWNENIGNEIENRNKIWKSKPNRQRKIIGGRRNQ